jgi:hypothetical protein
MKKLIALLLAFCMALPFASCAKEETVTKEEPPEKLTAWAFHSFEKTVINVAPSGRTKTDYTVYLTKGESEGCQVAIYSNRDHKGVTLAQVSGENEYIKTAMFSEERAHKCGRKEYTDSLIPYYGKRLQIKAGITLPFMIEFTTAKDTPAGDYKYVYEIKDKDQNVLGAYDITVHVWDITLPEEKTFATSVGLGGGWVSEFHGVYEEWYEACLAHNMSPYSLPVDLLSSEADAYLSSPRVTSFQIYIPTNEDGTLDEATLLEYYNKLKTNPEWLEKAYFLPLDEPRTEEHLVELRQWEETLGRLCPGIEVMAPYYTNIQIGENKDQTEDMMEYTTFWCPKLCLWDDSQSYDKFLDYTPEKTFAERMNEQIAEGDRMWSYVCNSPDNPYSQMFIDTEGVNQRLLFWQFWQRDIDGFIYWSVNNYGFKEGPNAYENGVKNPTKQNPWETVNTKIPSDKGTIYGCGFLFYPGYDVGYGGAVPSIRAKIVRDGCDDIELLNLAEQYLGKEWLLEKTYKATPSLTEFVDEDKFAALRIEIGNALEAAMKNQ